MKIGENIRKLRESRNMSQAELAKAAGYKNRSSITKIESGESDPTQKALVRIALALDANPADLLDDAHKSVSDKRALLMNLVENVPEEKISLLIRLFQSVLEDGKE